MIAPTAHLVWSLVSVGCKPGPSTGAPKKDAGKRYRKTPTPCAQRKLVSGTTVHGPSTKVSLRCPTNDCGVLGVDRQRPSQRSTSENHLPIREGWSGRDRRACLFFARNRYTASLAVVMCPMGCDLIGRHPVPQWHRLCLPLQPHMSLWNQAPY